MQKKIKKMIYIIIGLIILALAGFLMKYYFFNSTKVFTKGSEVVETGIVTERIINSFSGRPPLTFIIKNTNNVEFKVITDFTKKESVNSIKEGDNVEIYGKVVKTDTISLFGSKDFYIKKNLPKENNSEITEQEKQEIQNTHREIAELFKKGDLASINKYLIDAGLTQQEIDNYWSEQSNSKDMVEVIHILYTTMFIDVYEKKLVESTEYQKGNFDNGTEYIKVAFIGHSDDTYFKGQFREIHTFVKVNSRWYWIPFNFNKEWK